jgi:pilus assembly protein CpaC
MMKRPQRKATLILLMTIAIISACTTITSEAIAKESVIKLDIAAPQRISLMVGKAVVIETPVTVKRVSLAATAFADAIVLSPRQVYVIGKTSGLTNMILWEGDNVLAAVDIEVYPDIVRLKEKLHEVLPQEQGIKVSSSNDAITLSGIVSSAANLSHVIALAAPFGKVVNLLEVGGVQQVMLEVRVSEISKSTLKRLGINFTGVSADGSKFGVSLLNNLSALSGQALGFPSGPLSSIRGDISGPGAINISSNINAIFRFIHNGATWTGFIDALKENGLLTVLAEPTLTALSGQTASFNAGGEVPIPEASGLGTVAITYKKFGVGLSFTPTVLSEGKISMKVSPTVSDVDFNNAIQQNGFLIPGFVERDVTTVVELADGQSFALAGLLSEKVTEDIAKFPLLGDIPILGALFRSSSFKKNESELVVIVTPHLVKPLDMSKQTLPTDKYGDPGDFRFYLLGDLVGSADERKSSVALRQSGFDGEVGHIVPK